MVGALIMPFPRNAEKYLCLHYVGSLGAELDLCSGEAGLETEWSIVGQGVNPAVTNYPGISGHPAFLLIFQSSNELCVADSLLSRAPHHIPPGQKKKASDLRTPSRYLSF